MRIKVTFRWKQNCPQVGDKLKINKRFTLTVSEVLDLEEYLSMHWSVICVCSEGELDLI